MSPSNHATATKLTIYIDFTHIWSLVNKYQNSENTKLGFMQNKCVLFVVLKEIYIKLIHKCWIMQSEIEDYQGYMIYKLTKPTDNGFKYFGMGLWRCLNLIEIANRSKYNNHWEPLSSGPSFHSSMELLSSTEKYSWAELLITLQLLIDEWGRKFFHAKPRTHSRFRLTTFMVGGDARRIYVLL